MTLTELLAQLEINNAKTTGFLRIEKLKSIFIVNSSSYGVGCAS